ncbi:unnamed protein product [Nesidiocoris tenuis]|uniref:Uncharacterized protein n=1 Tax=Nesidiocoris tenuis TaxID=355587 RepID=A0A6H5G3W5_9HEMI|nr:unnamed protein product [Nesidiocoris tenuis]
MVSAMVFLLSAYGALGVRYFNILVSATAPEFVPVESNNWLIHARYVRKEFDICQLIIQEDLVRTKGFVLQRLAFKENATKCFEQAIKLDADDPMIRINFISHLASLDQKDVALEQLNLVQRLVQPQETDAKASGAAVIDCLTRDFIPNYGPIKAILSDNGTQFTSAAGYVKGLTTADVRVIGRLVDCNGPVIDSQKFNAKVEKLTHELPIFGQTEINGRIGIVTYTFQNMEPSTGTDNGPELYVKNSHLPTSHQLRAAATFELVIRGCQSSCPGPGTHLRIQGA